MKKNLQHSILLLALLFIPFISKAQISGEVTVGTGGSYSTLSEFADSLNSLGMSGNTTVYIISDIIETVPVIFNRWEEFGGYGYYLTIKPFESTKTIQGEINNNGIIVLNNISNVIIDGELNNGEKNLNLCNTATSGNNCIVRLISSQASQNCTNITIRNCVIKGGNANNTSSYGIIAGGENISETSAGYNIDSLTIENNIIKKVAYGINAYGSNWNPYDKLQILNNEIGSSLESEYISYIGINIYACPNALINKNYIHDVRTESGSVVIGIQLKNYNNSSSITNNIIHSIWNTTYLNGGGAYGINIESSTNNNILIANNAIYNLITTNNSSTSTSNNPFGLRIMNGNNIKIFYNSINLYGTQQYGMNNSGTLSSCLLISSSFINGLDIQNNVFSNTLNGLEGSIQTCIYHTSNNYSLTNIDFNDYYVGDIYGRIGYINSNWSYTLPEWQNATAKDLNSISVNPQFTADTNLMPLGSSSLFESGLLIEGFEFDILGNERYNPPTIGAYEIQFGNDLRPPHLISPLNKSYAIPIFSNFIWNIVEDATSYYIQIATDSDFINNIVSESIAENTYLNIDEFEETTQYYWRVKGEADGVIGYWSQVWSFFTDGELEAPTLLYPVNNSVELPTDTRLEWVAIPAANEYNIEISTDSLFNDVIINEIISQTFYNPSSLEFLSQYWWRVSATNGINLSPWSETWNFSTGYYVQIGTDLTYNSGTSFPAPYGNSARCARHQILITAEEYLALGGQIGTINSLAFNIYLNNNCGDLDDFTIKMKHTEQAVLQSFEYDDWTTCYIASPSYIPSNGWNIHQFETPFEWDGESNILIETCYFSGSTSIYSASHYNSLTPSNSVGYKVTSTENICSLEQTNISRSRERPNMRFSMELSAIVPTHLIEPLNNSFGNSLTPYFEWNSVENAVNYTLQIALDSDFNTLVTSQDNIYNNYYQIPSENPLDSLTLYYWRVRAIDEFGNESFWSKVWNFGTLGDLPAPTLVSPFNGNTDVRNFTSLVWNEVFGAEEYIVQISSDSTFDSIIFSDTTTESSSIFSSLLLQTDYWWRVLASYEGSNSPWSEYWSFTTGSVVIIGTGTTYNSPYDYPAPFGRWNGSTRHQQLITSEELIAAGASAGLISKLYFDVFSTNNIDALNDFTIKLKPTLQTTLTVFEYENWTTCFIAVPSYQPVDGLNSFEFQTPFEWDGISNILIETCFYSDFALNIRNASHYYTETPSNSVAWYIGGPDLCILNPVPTTNFSNLRPNIWFEFDISNIPTPVLISPLNNSIENPTSTIFDWDDIENVVSYTLEVSTNSEFSSTIINEIGIEVSSYQSIDIQLSPSIIYYWRVMAFDENGNSSLWSDIWKFSITGPLPKITLVKPVNNDICVLLTPLFTWNELFGNELYEFQIASDPGFNNIIADANNLINTNWQLTEANLLNDNALYFWRVRAVIDSNFGLWSDVWSFTTFKKVNVVNYLFTEENEIYNEFTDGTSTNFNSFNRKILVDLPFQFSYAGNEYDQLRISLDGWIRLGDKYVDELGITLSTTITNTLIVPLLQYLVRPNGQSDVSYKVEGTAPERCFAIQYKNVSPISSSGNDFLNFQVRFYEASGVITFNYGSMIINSDNWETSIGMNGYQGGVMDFISVTPGTNGEPTTASSLISNDTILGNIILTLSGKKFVFTPNAFLLNPPTLINPANNSNISSISADLQWNVVPDAEFYNIQISGNSDFTNVILDETVNINLINIELEFGTQYWWRVRAFNNTPNHSNWSEEWTFLTSIDVPWQVIETNNSSTIIVPTSINPMLGERPFAAGDAIALFYQNDNNEWACGGYGVWNGVNLGITVWGDNDTTEIKDGFAVDEVYTFKVWDSVLGLEWNANATYQEGPDNYQINGFSMLASLNVLIPAEQIISLNSGWNIISSFVEPENDTIPNIFEDVVSNIKIVKNGIGQMYDPAFNINTIGNWNYEDGYLVNMLNDNELTITGTKLHPEETPIILNNGWNLSAYLRDNEMSPTTALSSISSSLVLAKDNVGGIFMPSYGINTIGNMQAGQGYYFYMNAATDLTYPANSAQKAVAGNEITPLAKYNIPSMKNTGKNATLLISIENNDRNEIGVYNMNNELIGSGAVYNGVAAITIWGDDEATQNIDGAKDNEYLNVKLYNTTNNTSKEISLTQIKEITGNTEQNELYYKTNSIYFAKSVSNDESVFGMSIKNIPNPVESNVVFEFSLTDEANAEIQIYTSTGELVTSIVNKVYSAGLHRVNFDASNLANGMYNIVLSSGSKKVSSFMIVGK